MHQQAGTIAGLPFRVQGSRPKGERGTPVDVHQRHRKEHEFRKGKSAKNRKGQKHATYGQDGERTHGPDQVHCEESHQTSDQDGKGYGNRNLNRKTWQNWTK